MLKLLLFLVPLWASSSWYDPETGNYWTLIDSLGTWKDAQSECARIHGRLPSRLISQKALNNFFYQSYLSDQMPWVEYRLGGSISEDKYKARVFWMLEHETDPVYKDIWFVGARVKDWEIAYSQPHVQDSTSHFSIVCLQ